ncbi:conserved hypothetical protein [Talaromyces stipitatus ATCC 10500]|uniref:Folliculin-interacting protein N-terminal domain-containing protein n=1 Tax=Talaromyces stipitatus (strain ATCC 10500 / CBS 375.48 / QM 6759 / NRRL 1006) TaxID=441959 RepID=B8M306_TALSN|nr:uncharacterized protein TSTA_092240 [Talaromyces stipitatus ATCC 10500]EED21982.1 conserved hypothetical protein [Talaromyces stipitatus ATCC 10500]
MLGRLLSTFSAGSYGSRNPAVLESVTEEEHTSGLLFPDPRSLHRSSNSAHAFQTSFNSPNASGAGGYDDRGGLDLDAIKDFRIIIAQNAIGDRDEPCILLDSRGVHASSSNQGLGMDPQVFDSLGGRHSRTSSLSQASLSRRGSIQTNQPSLVEGGSLSQAASARKITSPLTGGAFSRARGRSSISSVVTPGEGILEPYHNRVAPENSDTDSGSEGTLASSPAPREVDTLASRHGPRNPLARTYSSGTQPQLGYIMPQDNKSSSRVTILITRMFSVNLPESRDPSVESSELPSSLPVDGASESGYPFPDLTRRRKVKEKKTPMYAVAMTIQIPLAARNNGRPMSRLSTHVPEGQKQMSFSLDSDPHWSSAFLDDNSSQNTNLDDRIDLLVDRWDVITRTLTYLEKLARQEILILLKKVEAQVAVAPKPLKPPNMQRTNQTIIQLRPNVLAHNSKLKEELLLNAQRISAALRIPRVILGQSRWGVWREEARWIARLMADKEHGLFFLVLITAFLGNHTEWLNTLGPEWYRRRHQMQQKAQTDSEPTIANRTVIISDNKMVARRLIFILSAFLPAKHRVDFINSPLRPGTSTSTRPLSQSPPAFPLLRQESLRRRINRRAQAQRFNAEESTHQRSVSVSSSETTHKASDEPESALPSEPVYTHNRRGSDVRSIRTVGLPISANEARTRATTSTTTNDTAVPVAYFASRQHPPRSHANTVGDETDSYASAKLLQNLRRSETSSTNSNGSNPTAGGKWVGSILSGFWSGRSDSVGETDRANSCRRTSIAQHASARRRSQVLVDDDDDDDNNQEHLQSETSVTGVTPKASSATETITIPHSSANARLSLDQNESEFAPTEQIKESPLKLSVQGNDGVVDVDLPLRGFLSLSSSNDSTIASPKKARTSITSMDASCSIHSSFSNINSGFRDSEGSNLNVAGWLKNFHEDFLLQAVRPYHGIEADVKRAMLGESYSHVTAAGIDVENVNITDRWVEVASTLIADTRTFTVKRLRLLRRGTPNCASSVASTGTSTPPLPTPRQTSENVPSTSHLTGFFNGRSQKNSAAALTDLVDPNDTEYKFIEEPVVDVDGTLVDAVERVLIQSGQSSLAHSRSTSPHRNGRSDDRPSDETPHVHVVEVPRNECRKTVLGALEEVARSVTEIHCREEGDAEFMGGDDSTDKDGKRRSTVIQDNTLREGVRKWLLDIEEAL